MPSTYVFDAYGTLFDVHAAVSKYANEAGDKGTVLSQLWRTKQLEYTWTCTLMGHYEPFWHLTGNALDFAMEAVGLDNRELRQKLLDAYFQLDAYPEVRGMLSRLKDAGKSTAILSNGSPEMLDGAMKAANIQDLLDDCLSVHSLGFFKPRMEVYRMVNLRFGVENEDVQFHSSNRWDVAAAKAYGFSVKWINRTNMPDEYKSLAPDEIMHSLDDVG